jgi:hypothetical protein
MHGVARADGLGSWPSAAVLDSQTVKSSEKGGKDGQVSYDTGKQLKGRKIHALVDSEELPMRVVPLRRDQESDGGGLGPR